MPNVAVNLVMEPTVAARDHLINACSTCSLRRIANIACHPGGKGGEMFGKQEPGAASAKRCSVKRGSPGRLSCMWAIAGTGCAPLLRPSFRVAGATGACYPQPAGSDVARRKRVAAVVETVPVLKDDSQHFPFSL